MFKSAVHIIIRFLLFFICKIDREALKAVPRNGPMILVGNHIHTLDAPVSLTALYPRRIVSLVKKETFANPFLNFLFNVWDSIPVIRGAPDLNAIKKSIESLELGKFFAIFPEGTRTKNGCLIKGHTGIVIVALRSGVPILPIVHFGIEDFQANIKKFKRTRITFQVGEPFLINPSRPYPSKEERHLITDEIMYRLARLLPEKYRGYYSDLSKATVNYLNFDIHGSHRQDRSCKLKRQPFLSEDQYACSKQDD